MTASTAYIGIGSNIGDRIENCKAAIDFLSLCPEIKILKVSRWYETKAVTISNNTAPQPDYINGAVQISTELSAGELLARLLDVEATMGRPYPRQKGEPRTIDLDLLLYEGVVIDRPELSVPHPELSKRLFVLIPMCDIAPGVVDPRSGLAISELRALCETTRVPAYMEERR